MSESDPPPAPRPDLRTLPLAVSAVIAAVVATTAADRVMTGLATAAVVACLIAAWRRRWPVCAAAAVLAVVALASWMRVDRLDDSAIASLARDRAAVTVTGRIASDPRALSAHGSLPEAVLISLTAEQVRARGARVTQTAPVLVSASGATRAAAARLPVGARVELAGVLAPSERRDPTAAVLRLRSPPRTLASPGALDRGVNRIRGALVASVRFNSADQRALVPSLVVGDTSAVSDEIDQEFRATALTHLMAVSGANLASTTALLWWAGSWLGLRRRPLRALSVVGVAGFVIVCRSEPSVVRAAAMGVVTLAAAGLSFDRAAGLRALCVAVMSLMLVDPWLSRSVGFWLSVCATAGILWWTTGWARAMSAWMPENLARAVVVPWAAQLATQPAITWLSGQVSTTGLIANLTAAPFVAPATALGMAAALLGALWAPLGIVPGWLAGWCVQPILMIAAAGARAPAAALSWPARPVTLAVLAGLCLGLALLTPWLLSSPLRAVLAGVLVLAASVIRPPVPGWPGPWQVAICDVGQGSAALVRADRYSAVLIDAGPEPEPLADCLAGLGIRSLPVIIASHYHADHVGGLSAAFDRHPDLVLVSPLASPAADASRVAAAARGAGAAVRTARAGDALTLGQARIQVVSSGAPGVPQQASDEKNVESSAENDSSVIIRAESGGLTALLPGDAEPEGQARARRTGSPLRADVLVMPHHGSSRQDELFWRLTGARAVVASAGVDNGYGHPSRAALALAARLGMTISRTDQQGTVLLSRAGGSGMTGSGDALSVRTRR
ncbi:ComEC/Rec2 family competence protein [Acidipropionibacterium virtanenii]|uniref:ComE operon protein 3 n=1 Tax=Acidipropionibacterium virtanenii TaxID=2057246 RepID=A0A344UV10_9ACTN|nr:ComEC/Rec2 family competence protein [Acidipropionibacterium virtanenii]AXE39108.1 ComE operon protein 3 [Acidipropionibacterium virtanenii]